MNCTHSASNSSKHVGVLGTVLTVAIVHLSICFSMWIGKKIDDFLLLLVSLRDVYVYDRAMLLGEETQETQD